jgi:hypothetical protein
MLALLLPYVELPDLHLFGLTVHPFGIFAALGVYTGAVLTVRAGPGTPSRSPRSSPGRSSAGSSGRTCSTSSAITPSCSGRRVRWCC